MSLNLEPNTCLIEVGNGDGLGDGDEVDDDALSCFFFSSLPLVKLDGKNERKK